MRTPRRLATLVLAVSASAALAACSSPVSGTATPVPQSQEASTDPAAPPVEEAGDTDPAPSPAPESTETDDDLPVPGAGVPGDLGLCQAVVGWYGYAGLSLISVDEDGHVDPASVVPLLEALRDAPADHQDAGAPLLAAAGDVSAATDEVIDQLGSGSDVFTAFEALTGPVTDFGAACTSAGVAV